MKKSANVHFCSFFKIFQKLAQGPFCNQFHIVEHTFFYHHDYQVPPKSKHHVIVGHCAEGCTRKILPPTGINVVSVLLHTHLNGRGVRVLQFRGGQELEWLLADDNYNFNRFNFYSYSYSYCYIFIYFK